MIVVLHGIPGREDEKIVHDTGKSFFQDTVAVPAVFMPPMSLADKYDENAPLLVEYSLTFNHWCFDGVYENYVFVSSRLRGTLQCP
jgi:hypothetical protein